MDRILKPCPFCGGEAEIKKCNIYIDIAFYVTCKKCHVMTNRYMVDHPSINISGVGLNEATRYTEDQAKEKAIEAWNRRADDEFRIGSENTVGN